MTSKQEEEIRLVVADVDGALVTPDKVLTPRARAAVRKITSSGMEGGSGNVVPTIVLPPYWKG